MTRVFTLILTLLLPMMAAAQVYPTPKGTAVNDYADMLDPATEARIEAQAQTLKTEEGVEIAVVTLSSVKFYANDLSIADYATGLFNTWGIGDPVKGNGILFIVFRDDRELRVELGKGYDAGAQDAVAGVVGDTIMPAFMEAEFPQGIEAGVTGLITKVALRDPTPATPGNDTGNGAIYWLLGGLGGVGALIFGSARMRAAKLAKTPCPACGKTGTLAQTRVTLTQATPDREGSGEERTSCSACGHVTARAYPIPKLTPKEKAAPFKGGQSKGDGASGKW